MPFTFSHPAIVLPLRKISWRYISLTGLVVGSLTPDFEYFIRMRIQSLHSHSLLGLFWFDVPLGILLAVLFHSVVKRQLTANLPKLFRLRFIELSRVDWLSYFSKHWFVVAYSVLIGAASHLFWDSFTHEHGYFAELLPSLKENFNIFERQIPVFKLLQHSSTLFGGLVILLVILKIEKSTVSTEAIRFDYWISVFSITFLVLIFRWFSGLNLNLYGNVLVSGISGFLLGITLTPLMFKILNPKN